MANDNKIVEDLIQISKDRFLPKEVKDQEHKVAEYSLAKEFAKTKKSFDYKFYSILGIFLLTVIGGTVAITTFVDLQNQKTQYTFNIEDINLQEQLFTIHGQLLILLKVMNYVHIGLILVTMI